MTAAFTPGGGAMPAISVTAAIRMLAVIKAAREIIEQVPSLNERHDIPEHVLRAEFRPDNSYRLVYLIVRGVGDGGADGLARARARDGPCLNHVSPKEDCVVM